MELDSTPGSHGPASPDPAAANFLMGEADDQVPAVLIKGLPQEDSDATASELIRPLEDDLFR